MRWNVITGSSNAPGWSTRDCQNGCAPDVAIVRNASPNTPDIWPVSNLVVTSEAIPTEHGDLDLCRRRKSRRMCLLTEHLILNFEAREPDYVSSKDAICGSTAIADGEAFVERHERR